MSVGPPCTVRSVSPRIPLLGRKLIVELVIADRERRGTGFTQIRQWPDAITGFEDLVFLFGSTVLAHGMASLRLDEAAYLYRLVRDERPAVIVEIGRYRGGSTFLLAAALEQGLLHSYDVETRQGHPGAELDRELQGALDRYGLSSRVHLHVEDSQTANPATAEVDLLFIDGDHSERGVRADFERWAPLVAPGGHVLLHDAVDAPDFVPTSQPGPRAMVAAVGTGLEPRPGAGSIAHFVRRRS
jgi:predicted O-methyltransferase YrrM